MESDSVPNRSHSVRKLEKIEMNLDESFEKLRKEGKTSIDGLVKWMDEAKIIDKTKDKMEEVRALFIDVKDGNNVELEEFKEALAKLAAAQKKSVDNLVNQASQSLATFSEALTAAAKAFKETLDKK